MDTIDFVAVAILAGLVVGAVEVIKQTGMPSRYAGVVAIVVGITLALIAGAAEQVDGNAWELALIGIMAGFSAAGAWSIPKAALDTRKD